MLVADMVRRHGHAVEAVNRIADALTTAIEATTTQLENGGRLIFVGAGTSGRVAAQDAAELPPTFNWPRERALVLIAGGVDALHTPVERAEDNGEAAQDEMAALDPTEDDVVIGVAASGTTPYTLAALNLAADFGAMTIGVCNRAGSPIANAVDHPLVLDTGPEFVHGSTRLAAGTAQKVSLNILTTAVMVRLGRVYDGQMIDMPPTNQKLEARAAEIVSDVAGCSQAEAKAALDASGNRIKVAIVMTSKGVNLPAAETMIDNAGGLLRDVL